MFSSEETFALCAPTFHYFTMGELSQGIIMLSSILKMSLGIFGLNNGSQLFQEQKWLPELFSIVNLKSHWLWHMKENHVLGTGTGPRYHLFAMHMFLGGTLETKDE